MLPERQEATIGVPELCAVCGGSRAGQRQFGPETPVELSLGGIFLWSFKSSSQERVPLPISGVHHLVIVPPRRLDGREQSGGRTSMCD